MNSDLSALDWFLIAGLFAAAYEFVEVRRISRAYRAPYPWRYMILGFAVVLVGEVVSFVSKSYLPAAFAVFFFSFLGYRVSEQIIWQAEITRNRERYFSSVSNGSISRR